MNESPSALGPVLRHRRPLARSRAAIAAGRLTVGFLGGSITAPKTRTRWPEPWLGWLAQRHPLLRPIVENAALGATGSDLGALRAGSVIKGHECDLVFVEYAVNDLGSPTERRGRTREGLLRQLIESGADVVLVYTYSSEMRSDMEAGRPPATIAEFEDLADHYGVGSVWAALHAWREVMAGAMTWPEWLPDGLHPEERGSLSYAQPVMAFCAAEWDQASTAPAWLNRPALPSPADELCWDRIDLLDLESPVCAGPWTLRRWVGCLGMDRALHTTVPGASLRIPFEGRGLVLGFDFGRLSSEVRYRIDGGPWEETRRDRPAWAGDSGWFRVLTIADELEPGAHVLELVSIAVPVSGGCGTFATIGLIGVIR